MLRTLVALRDVDAGFDPHNVLTLGVTLPEARYSTPARVTEGQAELLPRDQPTVAVRKITPGYLQSCSRGSSSASARRIR